MKAGELSQSNFNQWPGVATVWGGAFYLASVAIWHPLSEILFAGTTLAVTFPRGHALQHAPELPACALLAMGLMELSRWQTRSMKCAESNLCMVQI